MSQNTQNAALEFEIGDIATPDPAHRPIADLSYRNYDGPLHTRAARWWIVALSGLRLAKAKKGFWIATGISLLPYLIVLLTMYLQARTPISPGLNPLASPVGQKYASNLFQAIGYQGFFLFIIALLVGSGSIATDNRSNALMVYLSKPITKGDYLLGKWMGTFILIFLVAAIPSLILYLYCMLTYYSDGFFKEEPWLLFRVIAACAVPAAIHTSVILGFSAWSKTPRMAGAVYAGIYFIGNFVSGATWAIQTHGDPAKGILLQHLSIDGAIRGLSQLCMGVVVRLPNFGPTSRGGGVILLEAPSVHSMLLLSGALIAVGVLMARSRIRAVEVVKG